MTLCVNVRSMLRRLSNTDCNVRDSVHDYTNLNKDLFVGELFVAESSSVKVNIK